MKKIWIIAPFTNIEALNYRNRFEYIAKELSSQNNEIHLFTSNFLHMKKKFIEEEISKKHPFKIHLIKEAGYKKNISMKRGISHVTFAFNLKKQIGYMEKPDLIYCAYPMMTSAFFMGRYAKKNNIPFILDIQDIWPESISAGINIDRLIVKLLMYPFTKYANMIYRKSDLVIGVSETYANRGKVKNGKAKEYISVYIGAEGNKFEKVKFLNLKENRDEIWITYIGTLSHSYDIETALLAFDKLRDKENIKLYILGDGPDFKNLKDKANSLELLNKTIFFKGLLPYEEMINFLNNSDIALNAIKGKALQTITNKFSDYVSAGLPILNCGSSKEVLDLIKNKNLGLNYISKNPSSLKEKILEMLKDKKELEEYSRNCKDFAKKKFDRKKSYQIIFDKIQEILEGNNS